MALTTADGTAHHVLHERHPAKSYGSQFVILFTQAMVEASRTITSSVTLRLLFLLPQHLGFTDFRQLRTVEIAASLGTHSGNISRAMRELLQLGIVEREGTGPRTAWRMSSDWGWNGSADQYHAFRNGRMRGKKPPKAPERQSHNPYPDTPAGRKNTAQPTRLTLLAPLPEDDAA